MTVELGSGREPTSQSCSRISRSALYNSSVTNELAIAILCVMACGCSPTSPSDNLLTVRGQVINYRTGSPILGAVVGFTGRDVAISRNATTDQNGFYTMTLPIAGWFSIFVADSSAGLVSDKRVGDGHFTTAALRGDLFINDAKCVARYGTILDAGTQRPIAGARVQWVSTAVSGLDGWYRLDVGCPETTEFGNTNFIVVTHPNYERYEFIAGRGIQELQRVDIDLQPR